MRRPPLPRLFRHEGPESRPPSWDELEPLEETPHSFSDLPTTRSLEAEPNSLRAAALSVRPNAVPEPRPLLARLRFFATVMALAAFALALHHERAPIEDFFANVPVSFGTMRRWAQQQPWGSAAPCPEEMALIERDKVRVCVDRYEASLVEILPDGNERPWSPYLTIAEHVVKAVSVRGAIPQAYINRDEAQLACEAAGKRLCQADEWQTACEGPTHSTYPYGESRDERACNTHGKSPLGELFGSSFRESMYEDRVMNDPSLNALDGTVAKTGSHPACTNVYGVYDMVGNLHEWTAEPRGVFRGGYYLDAERNRPGCRYATTRHAASYHDYSTGFRCCRDPELAHP